MNFRFTFTGSVFALLTAVVAASSVNAAQVTTQSKPSRYEVGGRGASQRMWNKVVAQTNRLGSVTLKTNLAYVELATGLQYQQSGQWLDTKPEFSVVPGWATAYQGPHKVSLAYNLNTAGPIVVRLPGGRVMRSQVLSLHYLDQGTGQSVRLGEIKDCVGKVLPPNRVIYEDAFTDIKADVRFTYTKTGIEQDVIVRRQLPKPESFGLNPATTRLAVLTEFLDPPTPTIKSADTATTKTPTGDQDVDFGPMWIGRGKAFSQGTNQVDKVPRNRTPVIKKWVQLNGRSFLMEQVPLPAVKAELAKLPVQAGLSSKPTRSLWAGLEPPDPRTALPSEKPLEVAQVFRDEPGYVLDYLQLNTSLNNFTFQSGVTYLVSGQVNLGGTTTIEAGTVIKFDENLSSGLVNMGSAMVWPEGTAVLTSMNDDSVGDTIDGSSGQPQNGSTTYLEPGNTLNSPAVNLAISYANIGLWLSDPAFAANCQFSQCYYGIETFGETSIHDMSFAGGMTAVHFSSAASSATVLAAANVSVTDTESLVLFPALDSSVSFYLTNYSLSTQYPENAQDVCALGLTLRDAGGHFFWNECLNGDSNGNGMLDVWEWKHFGNLNQTAEGDYDGDGFTNGYEQAHDTDPNTISFGVTAAQTHVNGNTAPLTINLSGGVPFQVAMVVNAGSTNWQTFSTTNLAVALNSGDGDYAVSVGLRGHATNATEVWRGTTITRDTVAPTLQVVNPTAGGTVSNPILQIKGSASESLSTVKYDLSKANGAVTGQPAFITGQQINATLLKFTTTDFQAYDVRLATGVNTITVHVIDLAGNETPSTFTVTLDETLDHTAPTVAIEWPAEGASIAGNTMTLVGTLNDDTATVVVNKGGSTYPGTVFRGGRFSVPGIPLAAGANSLTVTAKDAANNSQSLTRVVNKAAFTVTLSAASISAGNGGQFHGNISGGLSVSGKQVLVNGAPTTPGANNTWTVNNVPISNNGEGGSLLIQVYPDGADPNTTSPDGEFLTVNALSPIIQATGYLSTNYFLVKGLTSDPPYWQTTQINWLLDIGGASVLVRGGLNPGRQDTQLSGEVFPNAVWNYASLTSARDNFYDNTLGGFEMGWFHSEESITASTQIELVTHGAVGDGDQLVRLTMTAKEDDDDETPIEPDKMKIMDKQLTATSTNASVGEVYVTVPAGSKTDLPVKITGVNSYTFDVQAEKIDARLLVDANRDGAINDQDPGQISATQPFRFWVNDDDDSGADINGNDTPGASSPDGKEIKVQGTRDLVDFFPVFLDLKPLLTILPPSASVKYKLKNADDGLRFVYTDLSRTDAFKYLKDSATGISLKDADTHWVTADGYGLNANWLGQVKDADEGVILVEGRIATDSPLVLSVENSDGTVIAEIKLENRIVPVETMFRHLNLHDRNLTGLVGTMTGGVAQPEAMGDPTGFPDNPNSDSRWLIFVHGFNVGGQASRGWNAEMFKRAYWSGNKSRFVGVSWFGNPDDAFNDLPADYHLSFRNAMVTAPVLAQEINAIPGSAGTKTMFAHSLGCGIISSAIADHGMNIGKACFVDAALALECFDGRNPNSFTTENDGMTPAVWKDYDPKLYAANWFNQFDPTIDARGMLTWNNRFSGASSVVYNFYSSTEDVLAEYTGELPSTLGGIIWAPGHVGTFGWVYQEKGKGNRQNYGIVSELTHLGSKYGGWGFNLHDPATINLPTWYVPDFDQQERRPKTPAEIGSVTTALLGGSRYNPLFKTGWGRYDTPSPGQVVVDTDPANNVGPSWIFNLYGATSGNTTAAEPIKRNQLLAEAIPSLTWCMGSHLSHGIDTDKNFNLPSLVDQTNWPRGKTDGVNPDWWHSDMREVAYLYQKNLFDTIITISKQ